MSALSTAEFERLSLIAAGVDPSQIPPILDTATWRRLLIAGLLKNAANQAIAGSVNNYSQLPVTVGAPAVGATYLVKYQSGIPYLTYKPSGIYVKITDTGSLSDWQYAPIAAVQTLLDTSINPANLNAGTPLTWSSTLGKWSAANLPAAQYHAFNSSDITLNPGLQPIATVTLAEGGRYRIDGHVGLQGTSAASQINCDIIGAGAWVSSYKSRSNFSSPPDSITSPSAWLVQTGAIFGTHIFNAVGDFGAGATVQVRYNSNAGTVVKNSSFTVTCVLRN